jgi:hypothetical protein
VTVSVGRRAARAAWILASLVVLTTTAIRLRLLDVPLSRDEGEYAYVGQLLLHGIAPYTAAYNFKLPGIYGVYAAILATFGQTPAAIHLGLLVGNIVGGLLVYRLTARLFTPVAGLAAGVTLAVLSLDPRLHGLAGDAEHFVLVPALAGALALLSAGGSRRPLAWFGSGVLFGLAPVVKQNGAAFVVFGALYMLLRAAGPTAGLGVVQRLVPTLVLLVGALAPYSVVCLLLALAGAFPNFWFWTVLYAYQYASNVPLADGLAALAVTGSEILRTAYVIVALAGVGAAALLWDREVRGQGWIVGSFVTCSFAGVAAGLHFRRQYFLLLVPSVAMLSGIAVEAVARRLRTRPAFVRLGVPLALVVVPLAHLIHAERTILFELAPEQVARAVWRGNPFPESIVIARYITTRTAPGERIAVIGSEPQIYFYARRPAATGFIYTYALMEPQPYAAQMQRQMIAEIEAANPRFVVFVYRDSSWLMRPDSDPTLFQWWKRYRPAFERVGSVTIGSDDVTTYAWGADAARETPRSVAIFERRPGLSGPPRAGVQDVSGRHHGQELTFQHVRAVAADAHLDHALVRLAPLDGGFGLEMVAHHHRSEKVHVGMRQDDGRLVHGQHGRVVGQAEGEAAVDEAALVGAHRRSHRQLDPGPGGLERDDASTELGVDGPVGSRLVGHRRQCRLPGRPNRRDDEEKVTWIIHG